MPSTQRSGLRVPERIAAVARRATPGYGGRFRRSARAWRRNAANRIVTLGPGDPIVVAAYWFDTTPNFGDTLTPQLLRKAGALSRWTAPGDADLIGVGSLVDQVPHHARGTLWGSGLIWDQPIELPFVNTLAVRGEFTLDSLGSPAVKALGDPAILMNHHFPEQGKRWRVGLIPHYTHGQHAETQRLADLLPANSTVIDVLRPASRVVRQIAACDVIVTSSLHGLILADSYDVPAVQFTIADHELKGGDFKFDDYQSVIQPLSRRRVDSTELRGTADLFSAAEGVHQDQLRRSADHLSAALVGWLASRER